VVVVVVVVVVLVAIVTNVFRCVGRSSQYTQYTI